MSQYTMQYGGGAGTGRAGSLLTPLLPRIAVGATHSSTLWHGILNESDLFSAAINRINTELSQTSRRHVAKRDHRTDNRYVVQIGGTNKTGSEAIYFTILLVTESGKTLAERCNSSVESPGSNHL